MEHSPDPRVDRARRFVARRDAAIVGGWLVLSVSAWVAALQPFHRIDWLDEDLNRARLSFVYEEDVDKFSRIERGMTRSQVEAIAGKPSISVSDAKRLLDLMQDFDTPRAAIDNYALVFDGSQGLRCVVYFTHDETVASVFLAGS
jgi:hypothetical protein